MTTLVRDVRPATRVLRGPATLTVLAVATLALGVGANTAWRASRNDPMVARRHEG